MTTGVRAATFERLQLNAGVFLVGFDESSATSVETLKALIAAAIEADEGMLGATRGGGSFECTPSLRNIEADGIRYQFKGSTVNDLWTIKLKTTLIESTPENFARALMSADVSTSTDKAVTTIKVRTAIKDSDYIPNICWIGDTSKGYAMIKLKNALNIAGATFTFTDKGEGTLPVEFQAHCASLEDQEHAPFEIKFFGDAQTQNVGS